MPLLVSIWGVSMPSRYSLVSRVIIYKMTFQWGKQAKGYTMISVKPSKHLRLKLNSLFFKTARIYT